MRGIIPTKKYLNQTFEICDKRLGIINLYFQTFDDRMENARWFYLFKDSFNPSNPLIAYSSPVSCAMISESSF